jgi:site-specific DNA-cytosine methylase
MTKLRVLDLFSGIGGFTRGLDATGGFETIAFVEINPKRRADRNSTGPEEQGFVTSLNRFVDRVEAKKIATAADQLTWRAMDLPELFSEDVW